MAVEPFEVFAIQYAHNSGRHPGENFLMADPHEYGSDLDYYVWLVRRKDCTFLVDTGFGQEAATRRRRDMLRSPADALRLLDVDANQIKDVIVTHLHYDHAGNLDRFPNARFHLQDGEMSYATGRCMCHRALRAPYDLEDVLTMVKHVFTNKAVFHDGDEELVPGLSLHKIGGHSAGLQMVRVWTRRGWVVLASDTSHLYANFEKRRPFPIVYSVADMLEGYNTLYRMAESPDHIIPGHDPLVLKIYPAYRPDLQGIVARLDEAPSPR